MLFYHHDASGNVTQLTNASGNVAEQYSYDIFGTPAIKNASGAAIASSAVNNRFLFTGREFMQELGLYDYRNRMYSPALGRFLQTDPIRFAGKDFNLYRYVFNDPVNNSDPYGLSCCSLWERALCRAAAAAAGVVGGAAGGGIGFVGGGFVGGPIGAGAGAAILGAAGTAGAASAAYELCCDQF